MESELMHLMQEGMAEDCQFDEEWYVDVVKKFTQKSTNAPAQTADDVALFYKFIAKAYEDCGYDFLQYMPVYIQPDYDFWKGVYDELPAKTNGFWSSLITEYDANGFGYPDDIRWYESLADDGECTDDEDKLFDIFFQAFLSNDDAEYRRRIVTSTSEWLDNVGYSVDDFIEPEELETMGDDKCEFFNKLSNYYYHDDDDYDYDNGDDNGDNNDYDNFTDDNESNHQQQTQQKETSQTYNLIQYGIKRNDRGLEWYTDKVDRYIAGEYNTKEMYQILLIDLAEGFEQHFDKFIEMVSNKIKPDFDLWLSVYYLLKTKSSSFFSRLLSEYGFCSRYGFPKDLRWYNAFLEYDNGSYLTDKYQEWIYVLDILESAYCAHDDDAVFKKRIVEVAEKWCREWGKGFHFKSIARENLYDQRFVADCEDKSYEVWMLNIENNLEKEVKGIRQNRQNKKRSFSLYQYLGRIRKRALLLLHPEEYYSHCEKEIKRRNKEYISQITDEIDSFEARQHYTEGAPEAIGQMFSDSIMAGCDCCITYAFIILIAIAIIVALIIIVF